MKNEITVATNAMSSLKIADITGKRHDHVIRDIKKQLEELEIDAPKFGGYYIGINGKELPMFNLDEEQSLILASGYNVKLRQKIIHEWIDMKVQAPVLDLEAQLEMSLIAVRKNKELEQSLVDNKLSTRTLKGHDTRKRNCLDDVKDYFDVDLDRDVKYITYGAMCNVGFDVSKDKIKEYIKDNNCKYRNTNNNKWSGIALPRFVWNKIEAESITVGDKQ